MIQVNLPLIQQVAIMVQSNTLTDGRTNRAVL